VRAVDQASVFQTALGVWSSPVVRLSRMPPRSYNRPAPRNSSRNLVALFFN